MTHVLILKRNTPAGLHAIFAHQMSHLSLRYHHLHPRNPYLPPHLWCQVVIPVSYSIPRSQPPTLPSATLSFIPSGIPSTDSTISSAPSTSSSPTSTPTCYGESNVGWVETISIDPDCKLHRCAGHCEEDGDCRDGLICHKKEKEAPFCEGAPHTNVRYYTKVRSNKTRK